MDLAFKQEKAEVDAPPAGSVEVADSVFGAAFNEALVHQVVNAYVAGARSGTRAQKNRSDVRGGGAKPWRQKGTGRARAGSSNSPIWRGGGVTFAARPTSYEQKVNKKMYRAAMRSIVSELVRQGRLVVVDSFAAENHKTRELVARLQKLGLSDVLIVAEGVDDKLELAVRNLHWADVRDVCNVDPVAFVAFDKTLITLPALKKLEQRLA